MLFTVLGLLLTVAIVGLLVKKQMSAITPAVQTPAATTAGQMEGAPPMPANQVQQVRDDVQKALAQGAAANAAAASAANQ
ncbi:MAG: hypothetical protein IV097_18935 [Burkholderiaceae bacterium]|nr:hypothetical protein [Burkholderiaceae bacterium]